MYYVSESSMRLGISVARPNLVSLGTCFGKFSKNGKFKLHITSLDYLAQYAKYRVRIPRISLHRSLRTLQVWIKPNGEMPFLYGNHVVKAHLGRITEDTPEHQGVVVFNMSDIPLVRSHTPFIPSSTLCLEGLRCHRTVHSRYKEIRSNSDYCLSSSVSQICS